MVVAVRSADDGVDVVPIRHTARVKMRETDGRLVIELDQHDCAVAAVAEGPFKVPIRKWTNYSTGTNRFSSSNQFCTTMMRSLSTSPPSGIVPSMEPSGMRS